jgi:2-oxoglutarate ferredoxin oxidoreductase subunit beta
MTAGLSAKDFTTAQEVRWCPGCGDYAVLKSVTQTLADVGAKPESTAFVSGIGCAARFPYYVDTYGFHTIHGRAPAIATGLKLTQPELDVWVVTGDGDGLSIGGNHLLHALRRNVGIKVLLFNNEIYGLTKGQYSPTARQGTISASSPAGSIDAPLSAGRFALGAGAEFFARAIDTDRIGLGGVLREAYEFDGASMTEIFQNCIVYNDRVFASFTDRDRAADRQLRLTHGEPMLFGANNEKGIRFNPDSFELEVVDADTSIGEVLRHDVTNRVKAQMLVDLTYPVALGVIYKNPGRSSFEKSWHEAPASGLGRSRSVKGLLRGSNAWTVD